MRNAPNLRLDPLRIDGPPGANCGAFQVGACLFVVSDGGGWDHVSVSRRDRLPTWDEMDRIKRLVFRDDEIVMQLHISDDRKVDIHKYCLHLWRPQTAEEIARIKAQWIASGEPWPYGELEAPGVVPTPPRQFV